MKREATIIKVSRGSNERVGGSLFSKEGGVWGKKGKALTRERMLHRGDDTTLKPVEERGTSREEVGSFSQQKEPTGRESPFLGSSGWWHGLSLPASGGGGDGVF